MKISVSEVSVLYQLQFLVIIFSDLNNKTMRRLSVQYYSVEFLIADSKCKNEKHSKDLAFKWNMSLWDKHAAQNTCLHWVHTCFRSIIQKLLKPKDQHDSKVGSVFKRRSTKSNVTCISLRPHTHFDNTTHYCMLHCTALRQPVQFK